MSLPLIVAAHDTICKKGDEWLFHGMADGKEDSKSESSTTTEKEIEDTKTDCIVYGIVLLILTALLGICYLIAP